MLLNANDNGKNLTGNNKEKDKARPEGSCGSHVFFFIAAYLLWLELCKCENVGKKKGRITSRSRTNCFAKKKILRSINRKLRATLL